MYAPVPAGGIFMQHRLVAHRSGPNLTRDQVRFSFDLRYQPVGFPTGRPQLPGFVARSVAHPETVLTDPAAWTALWEDARARIAGVPSAYNRW